MGHSRLTPGPLIVLLVIVILTALRPGDAPWVNDEPTLMEMALTYNHTPSSLYGVRLPFTPSPLGLVGTHGQRYGPPAVWLDQIFLVFTHNLVLMLLVRAVIFTSVTGWALLWLAKTLGLSPWFAVVTMLSPWLWLFSRQLWDSTWCIPISGLLMASYASFLAAPKATTMIATLVCCLVLPTIHLMAIAMVLPVLLHIVLFYRSRIWQWRWKIGMTLCVCGYLFWPYVYYSLGHIHPVISSEDSPVMGWLFPLLGGHFLTLGVAGTMPCDGWQDHAPEALRWIVGHARWISRVAMGVVWLGMVLAVPKAWKVLGRSVSATLIDHLCFVAVAVWACQTVLDGVERIYFGPHYYSATWIAYIFFAWMGADWIRARIRRDFSVSIIAIYAVSLLTGIGIIAIRVAQMGGTRNVYYGTCISDQIEAVQKLRDYADDSPIEIQVPQWKLYPIAWRVLLELNPPRSISRPLRKLVVKYREAAPADAHIEVEEFAPS